MSQTIVSIETNHGTFKIALEVERAPQTVANFLVDRIKSVPTGAQGPFAKDAPLEPVVIHAAPRV